jgi:hypothetical protein
MLVCVMSALTPKATLNAYDRAARARRTDHAALVHCGSASVGKFFMLAGTAKLIPAGATESCDWCVWRS